MRLRFGIPLTVVLLVASSWLSRPNGVNVYYFLVGLTVVWIAYDSWRVRIREYRTQLALPPLPLAVAAAVAWPLLFPLYLRTRRRIIAGELTKGSLSQNVWPWLFGVAAVVVTFVGLFWFVTRDARRALMPLAQGIASEFSTWVNVSIHDGWRATITLPANSDQDRRDLAFRVAQYTHQQHVPELTSVVVTYIDVQKRGAATITRQLETYKWSYLDLRIPTTGSSDAGSDVGRD